MWATHGLAVALALSVLPGSRALRPGDCEGAAGWRRAERDQTPEGQGLEWVGAAAGPSGFRPRKGRRPAWKTFPGPTKHWSGDEKKLGLGRAENLA